MNPHATDDELDTLSQIEQQGTRFKKKGKKEDAEPIDTDKLFDRAMDENARSAWGMPGAYEVPEL